jgi:phage shock protein E
MKKSFVAVIGVVVAALALTSCSTGSSAKKVDPQGFYDATQQAGIVVLDVRTPAEFAEGHLPNAINVDFESGSFEEELAGLDKSATYAVYCRSGNRSGQATAVMSKAGFENMYDLQGGVLDWQAAGGTLVNN